MRSAGKSGPLHLERELFSMVEDWPRRALSPGPQSSSLLASSWKSIGSSHSYEMRGVLPASAATRVRQPRWSAGGQDHGRRGLGAGAAAIVWPRSRCHLGAVCNVYEMSVPELRFLPCVIGHGETVGASSPPFFGALVLCVESI